MSLSGKLQLYSLAVPTEKAGATTTKIVMTVPERLLDRLVRARAPGWHRVVQQTGSGDSAVIKKVTWTGGHVPTGEDSLFQFLAQPASSRDLHVPVQQTYSDGSIVNWSGSESSAAPAPTIEAKTSLGGGGVSVVTIIALDLRRRSDCSARRLRAAQQRARERRTGSSRETARGGACSAWSSLALWLALPGVRLGPRLPDQDRPRRPAACSTPRRTASQLTYDEAVEPRFAIISVTNADGRQETTGAGQPVPVEPRHAGRARCGHTCPRAGT